MSFFSDLSLYKIESRLFSIIFNSGRTNKKIQIHYVNICLIFDYIIL